MLLPVSLHRTSASGGHLDRTQFVNVRIERHVIARRDLTIGNLLMMQSLLVADRFGVKDFPQISARVAMVATMGMAAGPFALGWLRDNAGGYKTSYVVATLCSAVALGVFSFALSDSKAFDA